MSPVAWQPWHTAAFLDAQRRRRPILLLLDTAWAPACAAAHESVFARPDVQQAIADTVVAVRVDADRRPDIADRYGLGQWPSVLVLTPEGLVVTGGCQLDDEFASRLRRAAAAFSTHDHIWRRGVPVTTPRSRVCARIADVVAGFDDDPASALAASDRVPRFSML